MNKTTLHSHQSFAGYRLVRLLGRGQGGEVWSALNRDGLLMALKIFPDTVPAHKAEAEFNLGQRFQHPNILSPLAFGRTDEGVAFYSMPLCDGRSADNAAGYFTEEMAWKVLLDISSGLGCLHSAGYCHGDVKPSNLLRSGKDFLLSDFGSCFEIGSAPQGNDLSSYIFSAPDKIKSEKSDIWSLGASVFNLVMGSQVFNGMGGKSQNADSVIPYMRKSMPELSGLIVQCLSFCLVNRPSAGDIMALAERRLQSLSGRTSDRPLKKAPILPSKDEFESFWPETMIDCI